MKRLVLCLFSLLVLPGCGVVFPYMYDAGKLDDRLTVSMSKEQVVKKVGKPDRVVQDDGRQAIWEYRLYAKSEWVGYLVHCPFHFFCYFPAQPPSSYYLALQDNRLCMWGTPDVVRTLAGTVCVKDTKGVAVQGSRDATMRGVKIVVIPVFMPPPIATPVRRLAVIPLAGAADDRLTSWLDLTLNFLRSRHPGLVLVEREDLRTILDETGMQYTGQTDDETTVRVGKLSGADSLLTYRLSVSSSSGPTSASLDLRLLNVENGTTLFRQITTATAILDPSSVGSSWRDQSRQLGARLVVEEAAAYGFAALEAAFRDNPLGVVPDHTWPREGLKLVGLLQGSPAYHAGLREGDRIVGYNSRPLRNWADPIALPSLLTVERNGDQLEINVDD